jgi:hypothetical protein
MMKKVDRAFTLAEMLLSIAVLTLLILLVTRLVDSASSLITLAHKRIDADAEARPILDRMALDFAQMVKRSDVSYYLKTAATLMTGNDRIGFYSMVQGYYPTTPSPVSVVAYRVNSDPNSAAYNRLERMGKGLDWNGASTADSPIVFLPATIDSAWPSVASTSAYDDTDPARRTYEIIAPQVFRFEYYYLDSGTGASVAYPATWSSPSAVAINQAAAIVVAIAVIEPKSKVLLTDPQIAELATRLPDYVSGMGPGQLLAQWQSALDGMTDLPRQAISGVRLYERCFYLSK